MPVNADTPQDFTTEVLQADRPVVVDFWAPWCGPCRMVAPELDKLATEYGSRLKIVKVNVDENPSAAATYKVQSIPMIGLFYKGELVRSVVGARPARAIETDLALAVYAPAKPA